MHTHMHTNTHIQTHPGSYPYAYIHTYAHAHECKQSGNKQKRAKYGKLGHYLNKMKEKCLWLDQKVQGLSLFG